MSETARPKETRIIANHERFSAYADAAEADFSAGRLAEAAMNVSLAAGIATHTHCGVFASARLETVIHGIAAEVCTDDPPFQRIRSATDVKRVLHVISQPQPSGGLTRMLSRWIDADPDRTNSVIETMPYARTPDHLVKAVARSGGTHERIDTRIGCLLDHARYLRERAREHDLIILHIKCEDVIPLIAFARQASLPPVLFLNHADHIFWLGSSVSHAVLSLRDAAADIVSDRRGVSEERNLMLPTLVDPVERQLQRAEVRKELGVAPDEVLLVSVARAPKYRNMHGLTYADRHVELLKKHPNAKLMVVGVGKPDDWQPAQDAVGGRITPIDETPDVYRYLEAADIYVDSYPFVSSTSQMEAARYGLPIVSMFEAPEEARIVGINHLGLEGTTTVAHDATEYNYELSRLIGDPGHRRKVGKASLENVANCCQPPAWNDWLERAYDDAAKLPVIASPHQMSSDTDRPRLAEPDIRHQDMFGSVQSVTDLKRVFMGRLPLMARLRTWNQLRLAGDFTSKAQAVRLLLPSWLVARLKQFR